MLSHSVSLRKMNLPPQSIVQKTKCTIWSLESSCEQTIIEKRVSEFLSVRREKIDVSWKEGYRPVLFWTIYHPVSITIDFKTIICFSVKQTNKQTKKAILPLRYEFCCNYFSTILRLLVENEDGCPSEDLSLLDDLEEFCSSSQCR